MSSRLRDLDDDDRQTIEISRSIAEVKNLDNTLVFSSLDQCVQDEILKTALRLVENGYEPVPVFANDKRPLIREWQCPNSEDVTIERFCAQLLRHPDHKSIGLLTR